MSIESFLWCSCNQRNTKGSRLRYTLSLDAGNLPTQGRSKRISVGGIPAWQAWMWIYKPWAKLAQRTANNIKGPSLKEWTLLTVESLLVNSRATYLRCLRQSIKVEDDLFPRNINSNMFAVGLNECRAVYECGLCLTQQTLSGDDGPQWEMVGEIESNMLSKVAGSS